MSRSVAFDLSRLFIGPVMRTPRGIDRVDLAFARHFLGEWDGDCVGTLPTPWGVRWFTRERSLRVVDFIEKRWGETENAESDPAYAWVKARLKGERPALPLARDEGAKLQRLTLGILSFVHQNGIVLGSPIHSLPKDTVYLNVGQHVLAVPSLLSWLGRRPDIKPVFMMQDVIPIEFPEYCSRRLVRLHRAMLASIARHAAALLLTTKAAECAVRGELAALGRPDIDTVTALLPVAPLFLRSANPDPELGDLVYFVVCGSIEPRKNLGLLLSVWRELVRRRGKNAPKLVVAGSRSAESKEVLEMLDRCEVLHDHVIEVGGLSSPGLRQLVAGARALLMPSFAEGFGLPIVEALAVGTPAIASDLACHKEAAGPFAQYLSPLDGLGWIAAIEAHVAGATAQLQRERARSYRPPIWKSYFQQIEPFVLA